MNCLLSVTICHVVYTLRVRRTEKRNNDVESHWKGPYTLPWIHWHNCIEAETKMWLRLNGISVINTSSIRTHIFQIQFRANRLCFISMWTHTTQINSKSKSYHHCSWTSGCFFTHFFFLHIKFYWNFLVFQMET